MAPARRNVFTNGPFILTLPQFQFILIVSLPALAIIMLLVTFYCFVRQRRKSTEASGSTQDGARVQNSRSQSADNDSMPLTPTLHLSDYMVTTTEVEYSRTSLGPQESPRPDSTTLPIQQMLLQAGPSGAPPVIVRHSSTESVLLLSKSFSRTTTC